MKRIVAIMSLIALLLCGCNAGDGVYVPTGDGLYEEEWVEETQAPEEEVVEQELVLAYYPDETMNPYTCTDYTNRTLFSLLYQGLFAVDSDYQVHPMLCSRYTVTENMKCYVFYVENATFSDGSRLTPEDVYASFQKAMTTSYYRGRFRYVDSVKLGEDGGIIFYLSTPYENLPILLDIPIVKSTEVDVDRPLGTGPYLLEDSMTGLRLRRRTDWWCNTDMVVTASAIPLIEAHSETQIRDAFQFENVGLVCANPGSDHYADYRCDYELSDCENGTFVYIACNMQSKLFSNQKIRAALTYAIDRDKIVEKY